MRIFYAYLWIVFQYSLRLYFRKIIIRNKSNYRFGRTIFVSNHQGSFMDPLLIASIRKPIVYFMVRADVFNRLTERIFLSAHMLPIYRMKDGVDTMAKNQVVFTKTNQLLSQKRNILIFGEGFTHDRIQRRLHTIKKGPARIGFSALEFDGWKNPIYLQGLGVNYADFNLRRSEVLVAAGVQICLNDFEADYRLNPAKTISEVTRMLDQDMRKLVPDVKDPEWCDFNEDLMMFTRKGIHPQSFNKQLTFEQRWEYALRLAQWVDGQKESNELIQLREKITEYKCELERLGIDEEERYLLQNSPNENRIMLVKCLVILPFAILGFLHAGWIIHGIKWWVERNFKRPVYWGSTKLVIAMFLVPILNLGILFVLPSILPIEAPWNWGITCVYYLSIGIHAAAYLFLIDQVKKMIRLYQVKRKNVLQLNQMYVDLMVLITEKIPVQ